MQQILEKSKRIQSKIKSFRNRQTTKFSQNIHIYHGFINFNANGLLIVVLFIGVRRY